MCSKHTALFPPPATGLSRGSLCTEVREETSHQQQDSNIIFWSQRVGRTAKKLCLCYRTKREGKKKSHYLKPKLDQRKPQEFTPISTGFAKQAARAWVQLCVPRLGQDTPSGSQHSSLKSVGVLPPKWQSDVAHCPLQSLHFNGCHFRQAFEVKPKEKKTQTQCKKQQPPKKQFN